MTNWILLGGCLLGLFGVERAQRVLFPGEAPLWGWWRGRTRRQEKLTGGDSVRRITPQFAPSLDQILPKYSKYVRQLETSDPMEIEERLRRSLFETQDRDARILLTGLLAQASLHLDNRSEAHSLIEEAEESLRTHWKNLDPAFRVVAEKTKQMKALLYLQEGNCPIVFDILDEVENLFGPKTWNRLLRAETHLLGGEFSRTQGLLESFLKSPEEFSRPREIPVAAWTLLGESYLREHRWDDLERILSTCDPLKKGQVEDWVAVLRMRVELHLRNGDPESARTVVGEIHDLTRKYEHHRGIARAFHLARARVCYYELNTIEALRRLQLAENDSRYPVARWEVDLFRAFVLETETRLDEAQSCWETLERTAVGTYYGKIASARVQNLRNRSLAPPMKPILAEVR